MRPVVFAALAGVMAAGCNRLLGLKELPTDSGPSGDRGIGDDIAPTDDTPPATQPCAAFKSITPVMFDSTAQFASDFSIDASGTYALMYGAANGAAFNLVHALKPSIITPGAWGIDGTRDTFDTGVDHPRLSSKPDLAFASTLPDVEGVVYLRLYTFGGAWSTGQIIDAAVGATPQPTSAVTAGGDTALIELVPEVPRLTYLRASTGYMAGGDLNAFTNLPIVGVSLSPDGLVLVYSQRPVAGQATLYVARRQTPTEAFALGDAIQLPPLPNMVDDPADPQIFGACQQLYFRLGTTEYVAQ